MQDIENMGISVARCCIQVIDEIHGDVRAFIIPNLDCKNFEEACNRIKQVRETPFMLALRAEAENIRPKLG